MAVFLKKEITAAIEQIKESLAQEVDLDVILESEKDSPAIKTMVQGILKKRNDGLTNSILEIILSNALEAEKISPGGLKQTIKNFLNYKDLTAASRQPTLKEIKDLIFSVCSDDQLSEIVLEALTTAGFGGRVALEKSPTNVTYIELKESYEFDAKHFEKSNILLDKPFVVCIDGYIESVAEINRLLEDIVATKRVTVLLCRGYHDDVISTVKLNNSRKTFSVYPVIIPFDIENVNTMADLGVAIGKIPISSTLGQLITSVCKNEMTQVEEVKITEKKIYIKNSKTSLAVSVHVNNLLQKRSISAGVEELLERRIKSLSCKSVTINLPEDHQKVQRTQKVDACLRAVRSAISYGITENSELYGTLLASEIFAKKIKKSIENIGCVLR